MYILAARMRHGVRTTTVMHVQRRFGRQTQEMRNRRRSRRSPAATTGAARRSAMSRSTARPCGRRSSGRQNWFIAPRTEACAMQLDAGKDLDDHAPLEIVDPQKEQSC